MLLAPAVRLPHTTVTAPLVDAVAYPWPDDGRVARRHVARAHMARVTAANTAPLALRHSGCDDQYRHRPVNRVTRIRHARLGLTRCRQCSSV